MDKVVSFCWRDAKEITPGIEDEPIICQSENGKILTFKAAGPERQWKFHAEKYHIKYWAYQLELKAE